MGMKLIFLHYPVQNLKESLAFYREKLGFVEAWREGEQTAALHVPDSDVQLMLEEDEHEIGPGGVFLVDSVDQFYEEHKETLSFIKGPIDIPPGRYAIYHDNAKNPIRILDFSKE